MATRLLQVLAFVNVTAGGQATLPHQLNENGTAVIPDLALPDVPGFTLVTCTATSCTVQNDNTVPTSLNLMLWRVYSAGRALGALQTTMLSPQPLMVNGGAAQASGGGGPALFPALAPPQMAAIENDYGPPGSAVITLLIVTPASSPPMSMSPDGTTITGFAVGQGANLPLARYLLVLVKAPAIPSPSGSFVTFSPLDPLSLPANQIVSTFGPAIVAAGNVAVFIYDPTTLLWHIVL